MTINKVKLINRTMIMKIALLILPIVIGFAIVGTSACETGGTGYIIDC